MRPSDVCNLRCVPARPCCIPRRARYLLLFEHVYSIAGILTSKITFIKPELTSPLHKLKTRRISFFTFLHKSAIIEEFEHVYCLKQTTLQSAD
jgi:hypothetical protein